MPPKTIKCRLCDTSVARGIEIFGKRGNKLSLVAVLSQHFSIKFTNNEIYSKFVCKKCWKTTEDFHKLYCTVKRIEYEYLERLKEDGTIKTDKITVQDDEIKQESNINNSSDSESGVNHLENHSGHAPPEPIVKVEVLVETALDDNDSDNCRNHDDDLPDADIIEKPVRKKRKCANQSRTLRSQPKRKIASTKHLTDHQQNTINLEEKIDNELGMQCEICNEKTKTFFELKKHFRDEHNLNGYLKCCGKKFFRRGMVYNHILSHNDPDRYKCEQCGKVYVDKERLRKHVIRHDPSSRKYQCSNCPKRFTTPSMLNTHFFAVHKPSDSPKSFICDICNKCFSSKGSVYFHILSVHTQKYSLICDICAKVYPSQKLLDYHYKTTHMKITLPKIQCTICGSWLAHLTGLKKHMYLHTAKQETCNICGKVTPNKNALRGHIRFVHNTELYNCNICDKQFKSRKTLQEHIGTHTGNSLYKCKYCLMDFNSGANMYKHRKKIHPIEWQLDRDKVLNGFKSNEDNGQSTELN